MRVHFIAIGGAAMHNLALALSQEGHFVSGSDDEIFEPSLSRLKNAGILPEQFGWFSEKISSDIDAVILGMHAREDNPELIRAKELNLNIYSYPEFLYNQTKTKTRIVISGSHGKTTITSMVMHVLRSSGINFDYMVGSQIEGFDTMVHLSESSQYAVFEGDEYLSSPIDLRPKFHLYRPHIALINGIAWDHINVFPTFENYCKQFEIFIELIEKGGTLLYYENDEVLSEIINKNIRDDITYLPFTIHKHINSEELTYLIKEDGKEIPLEIFGAHNMQNISGAKQICEFAGVKSDEFYKNISSFTGSSKRLQVLYEDKNTKIFLDFAHAPSKVEATVKAVREQYPDSFLFSFFELHTFSSLKKEFLKEYKGVLNSSDASVVFYNPEVVRHKKLPPITKDDIYQSFSQENLNVSDTIDDLDRIISKNSTKSKKVYLFMSSGNLGGVTASDLIKLIIKK